MKRSRKCIALGDRYIKTLQLKLKLQLLETASAAQQKAMTKLDKIREKQKQVGMKTHKLLDEVLPSTPPSESKSKGSGKRKDKGGDEKGIGRKKLKGK